MDTLAAVRYIDDTTNIFRISDAVSLDDAFAVIKRDVPNTRVTLVLIPGGKKNEQMRKKA